MVTVCAAGRAGAVQLHQADAPPAWPAWSGSPASLLAPWFEPVAVTALPVSGMRLTKASLIVLPASTASDTSRPMPLNCTVPE